MRTYKKAFAYIENNARLLVFTHSESPEVGIQVPAGTVEEGETSEEAVMREAREETGLQELELIGFLGSSLKDMTEFGREELHLRYFFHVRCNGMPKDRWRNYEHHPHGAQLAPIPLDFFWVGLDEVPELIADHDQFIPILKKVLRGS